MPSDGLREWGTAKYVEMAWDTWAWAAVCHGGFGWGGAGTMGEFLLPWCLGIGWVELWWLRMACGGLAYLEVCWAGLGDLMVTNEEVVLALGSWWRLVWLNKPPTACQKA